MTQQRTMSLHLLATLAAVALTGGCVATPPPSAAPVAPDAGTAFTGGRALLLRDGTGVAITFRSGPGSTVRGGSGTGRFIRTFDAANGTLGPSRVVSHTPRRLRFTFASTTCTLADAGIATCDDGTEGNWNAV